MNEIKYQLYSLIFILHLSFYTFNKEETFFFRKVKKRVQSTHSDISKSFTFHFRSLLQNNRFPKVPDWGSELFFVYITSQVKRQDLALHAVLIFVTSFCVK